MSQKTYLQELGTPKTIGVASLAAIASALFGIITVPKLIFELPVRDGKFNILAKHNPDDEISLITVFTHIGLAAVLVFLTVTISYA
jgi:hypothetical protein